MLDDLLLYANNELLIIIIIIILLRFLYICMYSLYIYEK